MMTGRSATAPRLFSRLRRAARADGGAAAVEFALVSLPFFMLLMGTMELGMIYFLSTTLDNALSESTREIRTGEMQTGGTTPTAATFKADICGRLNWLQSQCNTNLTTDVRTFTTFASVNMPNPVTGTNYDPSKLNGYQNTQPCQIVVVRAYYKWPLIAPGLDGALKQLSDGSRLITSTVAFQNEPFTPTSGGSLC